MKTEELRIGNYMHLQGKPAKVNIMTLERILYPTIHKQFAGQYNGIPLTEEWLLKLGFEKSIMYDNTYSLSIETLNGSHHIFIDINAKVILIGTIEAGNFEYVHQLQNLYFALTGKELEVKP